MSLYAQSNSSCCAINEVDNLAHAATPVEALRRIQYYVDDHPFVMFSGVSERKERDHASNRMDDYAQDLADLIARENLGSTTLIGPKRNPSSGNMVKVFMWEPDYKALLLFVEQNGGAIPNYGDDDDD